MEIKPYSKNAKKHPKKQIEQVANSIKEFGMNQPIVVDKQGVIIVGHGRYEALKSLGMEIKPEYIKVVDLTDEQAKAYRLADNKLNESEWDMNLVIEELKGLSNEMLDLTGFEKDLIIEADEKDDEVPETPEEPKSKLGDIYELGEHRVLCGDSTKINDVEILMNGKKADMVFTDPPYGFNYTKKSDGASISNDGPEFEQVIADALSLVQVDTAYVCGDVKTAGAFLRATSCLGEPKSCIVWVKPIQHRMHRYEPCHELIWFWGDNGSPFYGANVFTAKREIQKFHPTVKPVELVEYCLGSHKNKKLILDLFGGSGSTLIAAEKTGRICYGMELDPKYIDVIVQRYVDYVDSPKVIKNGEEIVWKKNEKIQK